MLLRGGVKIAAAPSVPTSVVSTVGAGDAFAAALTVALCAGSTRRPHCGPPAPWAPPPWPTSAVSRGSSRWTPTCPDGRAVSGLTVGSVVTNRGFGPRQAPRCDD
ncbi:PfkB family carbohydrate kinase [Microbacterium elymi]|uniref:PfkB family carbohydrate kinase n=1 Tax=Microbacterium elymi TaxID=2909587 RepID=UPI00339008D3